MKIEVNYQGKTYTLDTEEKVTVIQTGISRRAIARTFYYLFKATYSLPRLYGRLDPKDPLGSWKTKMQEVFSKLLSEELENSRFDFNFSFKISTDTLTLLGKVAGSDVNIKVEVEKQPELKVGDVSGPVVVDSFFMSSIKKMKPYFIPSCRVGLFSAFNRFTILQFESPTGIPRTLGLIADFINSMVLEPGYTETVMERQIKVEGNELLCEEMPVYNCEPEVLNRFILNFFVKRSELNSISFIEDPEMYAEDADKIILSFKGNVVVSKGEN
ncbi:hypothetical protein [Sulfuracidifex tepidarius]|uniref:Uncharacterized protein n=1 Tax=Sulfuracidifex tepidarius TaxID=1294262 RepID=A0A510E727_9CREN|nr:hypothetical protein [Sulfuracidifex tepidarius]BBG28287.1 hypothetical protein IC007_2843 [Sulfuracidifex tepidarius]